MKCVYSFWSKPFLSNIKPSRPVQTYINSGLNSYAGFSTFEDFLNSWVLSVELSSKHYHETELVTDSYGKVLLVDRLKLPFTSINTAIDSIPEHVSPRHWSLSKMVAYSIQDRPFVHVDADVYLWKRLPMRLENAPVFGQNTDSEIWLNCHYTEPYFLMYKFLKVLPQDFTYQPKTFHQWDIAICCGIVGGQAWELIRGVAATAVKVFFCEENKFGWEVALGFDLLWGDRMPSYGYISVVEQYGIAKECWHKGIWHEVELLLDEKKISVDMEYLKSKCAELGYTHLIDHTKKRADCMAKLRQRIADEYPRYVPLIAALVQEEKGLGAQVVSTLS